ncbi:MAG: NAD-dependent epimerase/dehydratase family protein [Marinisporobacter sp.]|jgi:nucleoside-diphosphate-sugar epimerase|nr:NAD-dependent epimerase/dehydratase family protein [Marinisporobacter sp.]
MKVLITGGYGFIGSHVVERFYKEGYEIYIIDNLSTGNKKNVKVKHKFYVLDIIDHKCEEIFSTVKFDVVVHLAAHIDAAASVEKPDFDATSNILGLINILKLSSKYEVKKFIMASSAAIYGDNEEIPLAEDSAIGPISPYGVSKLTGEKYCELWKNTYGLETVCLRFSNVYGPRQSLKGEGGVVAIFMNNLFSGKESFIYGTGEQTRDFIYVEDVVDAIYKCCDYSHSHVINVSVDTQYSVINLIDAIKRVHGDMNFKHEEPRKGDILHSRLSNKRAMNELNWSPLYTLEEGVAKTYKWYKEYFKESNLSKGKSDNKENKNLEKGKKKIIKKILPYIENILSFMIVVFLTEYAKRKGIEISIDIKLAYIIIIGIIYPSKQVAISILLSCLLFIFENKHIGHDMISLIYNVNTLLHFSLYIFVGTVLGYATDNRMIEIENKQDEIEEIKEKFNFLYEMHNESKIVRKELQEQILNAEDSFGKIYKITSTLDALEPEKIFSETVGVIEEIMKGEDVFIFSVARGQEYLRLISKSQNSNINLPKSIKIKDYFEIEKLMHTKEIFVNRELKEKLPMIMAPIIVKDQVIAIIAIYNMAFEAMALYKQNLFKVVTNMITAALARAYEYEQAIDDEKYVGETFVLKYEYFNRLLQNKIFARQKNNTEFVLLKIVENEWRGNRIWEKLKNSIRELDYIGVNSKDELFLLASNTQLEESKILIERLKKINIHAKTVEEDEYYGIVH